MIVLKDVTKAYGRQLVLDHVTAEFAAGQIHGIVGRNGSGKTVLFKCICGLLKPDQGKITVAGKRVGRDIEIPPKMGAILETPGFLPNLSGYKNLRCLAGISGKAADREIREAMLRVGLDPKSRKWVSKYSLGMRQRLGIAQAMMENPSLLLLDEPMNGLDNAGADQARELLESLRARGKTILLASHNPLDIERLCDTVWEMDREESAGKNRRGNRPKRQAIDVFRIDLFS